ncbi:MAG: hypothetical protein WC796_00020 [Candidatus Pacearchaeota archaeon]|jgi:hypothetical protein
MDIEEFKNKLRKYKKNDIIITDHALLRADFRHTELDEVKENIVHPDKLVYFKEQPAKKPNEKKYECYFAYSEDLSHKYVFAINGKIIIVTIIIINRKWQGMISK